MQLETQSRRERGVLRGRARIAKYEGQGIWIRQWRLCRHVAPLAQPQPPPLFGSFFFFWTGSHRVFALLLFAGPSRICTISWLVHPFAFPIAYHSVHSYTPGSLPGVTPSPSDHASQNPVSRTPLPPGSPGTRRRLGDWLGRFVETQLKSP